MIYYCFKHFFNIFLASRFIPLIAKEAETRERRWTLSETTLRSPLCAIRHWVLCNGTQRSACRCQSEEWMNKINYRSHKRAYKQTLYLYGVPSQKKDNFRRTILDNFPLPYIHIRHHIFGLGLQCPTGHTCIQESLSPPGSSETPHSGWHKRHTCGLWNLLGRCILLGGAFCPIYMILLDLEA